MGSEDITSISPASSSLAPISMARSMRSVNRLTAVMLATVMTSAASNTRSSPARHSRFSRR
jgi:hypothetical protein